MTIRQILAEIKTPVQRAMKVLGPHFDEIRSTWRRRLLQLGVDETSLAALESLTLEAHRRSLEAGELDGFREELERQAQILERQGVSDTYSTVALGLYLESCLPYLLAGAKKERELAAAVSRLVALAQYLTLSSSATERHANWRRVQERERHSISRDLHDDIGHNLLVLKLYLEMMTSDLKRGDESQLQSKLQEALALVSHAIDSVRRLMLDLGPAMLSQFGFLQAIKIYARQFTLRTGIQVQIQDANLPEHLPSSYETALYRVLQGALSNVVQHSHGEHVKVRLGSIRKSVLVMSIEDDGNGFDFASTLPQRAFGLSAMRERVEMLGGKFHIESWPARPGSKKHGTRIEVDLPLRGIEAESEEASSPERQDKAS